MERLKDEKHALLAPNKFLDKKIYAVPWYKERVVDRLRRQEVKAERRNRKPLSSMTDSSKWIFIKDGLDDFRDGLPPLVTDVFIRQKDTFPLAKHDRATVLSSLKQSAGKHRFTKEEICYSRTLPLVRRRRENVDDVEQGLLAHRLALFPHLMEAIPQEILEDVVTILDPEAAACIEVEDEDLDDATKEHGLGDSLEDEAENRVGDIVTPHTRLGSTKMRQTSANSSDSAFTPISVAQEATSSPSPGGKTQGRPQSSKNPYQWMYPRAAPNGSLSPRIDGSISSQRAQNEANAMPAVTIDKFRAVNEQGMESGISSNAALDSDGERHVVNVTKTFCDWVRNLGGEESNNIEESTILSLFAAGYETKPSLLVPIKVVELQNIPNELRVAAGVPLPTPPSKLKFGSKGPIDAANIKTISDVEELKEEERRLRSRANPEFGRFTYGAWYLPKRYWEKRDSEILLEDPRDTQRRQESDTVRKTSAVEEQLAQLSGCHSFIDFLQKKPRKPEFIQRVESNRIKMESEAANAAPSPRNLPAPVVAVTEQR